MPITIDLPGGTAQLRTSDELNNRQVKELRRAGRRVGLVVQHLNDLGLESLRSEVKDDDEEEKTDEERAEINRKSLAILTELTDEEDDNLDFFQRVCTVIRLIDWTLDLPLPTTPEDVDLLPRPIYSALTTEAAKIDLNENFGNDPEKKLEAVQDPKVLTTDSDDSEPSLAEVSP